MPNYAISDGSKIVNAIIADSKEVAEEITGMTAVEVTNGPWIGWTLEVDGWREPSPYPSWNWNGSEWQSPVPKPTLGGYIYTWNEESQLWDSEEIEQPYPSWVRDDNNDWIPPVEYPWDGQQYTWDENSQNWIVLGEQINGNDI